MEKKNLEDQKKIGERGLKMKSVDGKKMEIQKIRGWVEIKRRWARDFFVSRKFIFCGKNMPCHSFFLPPLPCFTQIWCYFSWWRIRTDKIRRLGMKFTIIRLRKNVFIFN